MLLVSEVPTACPFERTKRFLSQLQVRKIALAVAGNCHVAARVSVCVPPFFKCWFCYLCCCCFLFLVFFWGGWNLSFVGLTWKPEGVHAALFEPTPCDLIVPLLRRPLSNTCRCCAHDGEVNQALGTSRAPAGVWRCAGFCAE